MGSLVTMDTLFDYEGKRDVSCLHYCENMPHTFGEKAIPTTRYTNCLYAIMHEKYVTMCEGYEQHVRNFLECHHTLDHQEIKEEWRDEKQQADFYLSYFHPTFDATHNAYHLAANGKCIGLKILSVSAIGPYVWSYQDNQIHSTHRNTSREHFFEIVDVKDSSYCHFTIPELLGMTVYKGSQMQLEQHLIVNTFMDYFDKRLIAEQPLIILMKRWYPDEHKTMVSLCSHVTKKHCIDFEHIDKTDVKDIQRVFTTLPLHELFGCIIKQHNKSTRRVSTTLFRHLNTRIQMEIIQELNQITLDIVKHVIYEYL
jgi:hypothetical protein